MGILPGMEGGKPPQGKEDPKQGGEKKPMADNKNEKEIVVSKKIIKETDHSLAPVLVKLTWVEFWRRPLTTLAYGIGYFVIGGVIISGGLGVGAAIFGVRVPENARLSTQVGYVVTSAGGNILVKGGQTVIPAIGKVGQTVFDETGKAGAALVSYSLEADEINRTKEIEKKQETPNGVVVRYNESSRRYSRDSNLRRRRNTNTRLVRLSEQP